MPSMNAANVANTFNCGFMLENERPLVSSVAACSWMLISIEWPAGSMSAALPNLVDGFRSHDTKKQFCGYFFAMAT